MCCLFIIEFKQTIMHWYIDVNQRKACKLHDDDMHTYMHTSIGGLVGEVAYDSTNQSLIQNITCNGATHSINDCIISEGSCTCQKVISLICFGKRNSCRRLYLYLYGHTIEPTGCEEGAVRITDGLIENEGRLEVCVNGVWGSVCDDGWDKTDAHVACQQLGFSELGINDTCVSDASLHYI